MIARCRRLPEHEVAAVGAVHLVDAALGSARAASTRPASSVTMRSRRRATSSSSASDVLGALQRQAEPRTPAASCGARARGRRRSRAACRPACAAGGSGRAARTAAASAGACRRSSAATPIMYLGRRARCSREQLLADVGAAVERGVLLERLALLARRACRAPATRSRTSRSPRLSSEPPTAAPRPLTRSMRPSRGAGRAPSRGRARGAAWAPRSATPSAASGNGHRDVDEEVVAAPLEQRRGRRR